MRRALPLVLVCLAAVVAASASSSVPTRAAPAPAPVHGLHVAYRAAPLGTPAIRPPIYDRWWFEGTPADQATKVAGAPTATFGKQPPTGTTDLTQASTALGDPDTPADTLSAYWRAPYKGVIDGDILVNWYWTSLDPEAQLATEATVTVYADAEVGSTATRIGERDVRLRVAPDPVLTRSRIPVHGRVEKSLLIQVSTRYVNIAPELRILYGSAAHASGFSVPRPNGGSDRPVTQAVPFSGERLDVQAVDIERPGVEPTLGVDRRGNAFYVAATFDGPAGLNRSIVMRSFDGGASWEESSPSVAGVTLPPNTGDPYLYVDPMTDRVFSIDLYIGCSYLIYSDDRGATWTQNPIACGEPADDHQTLVAGVPPPGIDLAGEYPNVVYYCFNQVARSGCTRSLDGGATFEPGRTDPYPGYEIGSGLCGGLHGRAVTDSKGRLFVPKGHCGFPWMAVSEDGGDTWRRAQVSGDVSTVGVNVEAAIDEADNVYVTWWDEEFRLPWMSVSRDHGLTWGRPLLIAPPDVKVVNFPSIAAGAPGRVAVSFPGTTTDIDSPFRPWNSYVLVSTNALDATPVFQAATANRPNDPIHRGECVERCGQMLDFLHTIVSPAGEAWATVVDTCTEEEECITNTGPEEPAGPVAPSDIALAIRQRCGPALRGPARSLGGAGCSTVGAAPAPAPPPGKTRGLPGTTE